MKDLVVRQKYSAARRILNSVVSVSSGDETLRLMLEYYLRPISDPKCMKRYIRADADGIHNKLIFFLSTPKIKLLVPSVL